MTESDREPDEHEATEAAFSDYYERSLPEAEMTAITTHLDGCERCRGGYEEFQRTIGALSGLHKMAKPQRFDDAVADTIRRRSGGRFFGRKAFGDRVPFELLALLALVIGLIVFFLIWSSGTGSLRYDQEPDKPEVAPGARDVIPQP